VADRIKAVPTWIFHGAKDPVVPISYSIGVANRLKEIGGDVKLTLFPKDRHGPWNDVYNTPALYDWFLQHSLP
jgi:predicted peptidase